MLAAHRITFVQHVENADRGRRRRGISPYRAAGCRGVPWHRMDLFSLAAVVLVVAAAVGAVLLAVVLTAAEVVVWAVRRGARAARSDR